MAKIITDEQERAICDYMEAFLDTDDETTVTENMCRANAFCACVDTVLRTAMTLPGMEIDNTPTNIKYITVDELSRYMGEKEAIRFAENVDNTIRGKHEKA